MTTPLTDLICRAAKNHSPSYNFPFSARRASSLVLLQGPPIPARNALPLTHQPSKTKLQVLH